ILSSQSRSIAPPLVQIATIRASPPISAPAVHPCRYGVAFTVRASSRGGSPIALESGVASARTINSVAGTPSRKYPTNIAGSPAVAYSQNTVCPSDGSAITAAWNARHASPAPVISTRPPGLASDARGDNPDSGDAHATRHAGQHAPANPESDAP